jgi:hypothetical protein
MFLRAVRPTAETAAGASGMERFAQLLDEIEDIVSVLRQQFGLWPARRSSHR